MMTRRNQLALGAVLLALTVAPGVALAQQSPPELIEEITVTAQKREQSAQDVGISLTAISAAEIAQSTFGSAQEVTALAAGVSTVQPNGEANYSIAIRGVANSDFTTNVESPVAIYLDEVYISQASGSGFMLFDMERVEILRGPQGTLFGRNATGGLAHFVTRKPGEEFDGYAKATVGENGQFKFEGAVGGTLIEDQLFARASVSTHWNDGYITNRLTGRDLNNANDKAGRLQFLFTPNEDLSLLLNLRASDQDIRTGFFEHVVSCLARADGMCAAPAGDGETFDPAVHGHISRLAPNHDNVPGDPAGMPDSPSDFFGYADNDGDVFAGDYDSPGHNDLETFGISGTLNWDIGDFTLTSITDFSSVERDYIEDSDAGSGEIFNFYLTTDAEQFSQEIRVAGATERITWVAGLYYLNLSIDDSNGAETEAFVNTPTDQDGFGDAPGVYDPDRTETDIEMYTSGLDNPYDIETDSWSLFGQAEFELNEAFDLVAGFRWITEEKEYDLQVNLVDFVPGTQFRNGNPNIVASFVDLIGREGDGSNFAPFHSERDDSIWSARLGLNWSVNDDLLVYTNWNRGVKGGGFNAPVFPLDADVGNNYNDETLNYAPEELDAFEVGFKSTLAGGVLQLNGSVYYYNYSDYQAFQIIGLDTITRNADADAYGFELEALAVPMEGLTLRAGVAYNDIEVDLGGGAAKTTSVQSPEWNLNGLVRYEWAMFGGAMAAQLDADYRSEHFFALTGAEPVTEEGYVVLNFSISYDVNDAWNVTAFVRNLTDEEYLVQTFDLAGPFGLTEQYYGRPQWAGVSASYHF